MNACIVKATINEGRVKMSMGNLVRIKESIYILTCLHGIEGAIEVTMYMLTENMRNEILCKVCCSIELDLVLLKVKDETYDGICETGRKKKYCTLDSFKKQLPEIGVVGKMKIRVIRHKSKETIIVTKKELAYTVSDIELESRNSYNMPLLPYIKITIGKKREYGKMKGKSGMLLSEKGKIIGMLADTNGREMTLIGSALILRFLNEYEEREEFAGVCSIVCETQLCSIDDEGDKQKGLLIERSIINYNNYNYTTSARGMKLKKDDIICEIDGKMINNEGEIYDEKTGINVPMSTYVAMNYMSGELIPIILYRRKNEEYCVKEIKVKARPVETMRIVPIVQELKYYNYNGMIFTELSERIIEEKIANGERLVGAVMKEFINKPYVDNYCRIVILLDVKRNETSEELNEVLDEVGLPMKTTKHNTYKMGVLRTVNNRKVRGILDLMEETRNKKLKLELDENEILNIKFEGERLVTYKYNI